MARSVLIACLVVSLLSTTSASFAASQCPASELTNAAQGSPLYKLLVSRYGKPTDCQTAQKEDIQSLSMQFDQGAALDFSVQASIELNQQSATLPNGGKPLSVADAIKVLKATETDATTDGCKIAWSKLSHPAADGLSEADGKVCNCKALLTRQKGQIVKLGFSSAC